MSAKELAAEILARAENRTRFLVAVAGPPGAGKSTLAASLADRIPGARAIPMDGFHLDNRILDARGLRPRKGASETFDAHGFVHLVSRLGIEWEVAFPLFDRAEDLSRAAADLVTAEDRILLIEGNYLLVDEPPWTEARYDLTVMIDVPEPDLESRLIQRWLDHGLGEDEARDRAMTNDIPNGRLVRSRSRPADLTVDGTGKL